MLVSVAGRGVVVHEAPPDAMIRPLALGAYYPRYDYYLTALILLHGRWDLVTPELGEPMRTPHGPEVGDVMRGTAEPCGCTWDSGLWTPCPEHPASCQAVVLWTDETEPVQRCGVPIAAGETHCSEHIPRCEDCGVADPLDADGRCEDCARRAVLDRAALSRS
jgi:hypothetical protein